MDDMGSGSNVELDGSDWAILEHVQRDARVSVAALARAVNLSATAVTQRLARLQDTGVIREFSAVLDLGVLGLELTAYVRLRPFQGTTKAFRAAVVEIAEVVECHQVTGEDCFLLKVRARDIQHLEAVTERVASYGATTTSLVYSSLVEAKHITAATGWAQ